MMNLIRDELKDGRWYLVRRYGDSPHKWKFACYNSGYFDYGHDIRIKMTNLNDAEAKLIANNVEWIEIDPFDFLEMSRVN